MMGKQILVVDDSATIRQMLRFTLSGANFDVVEAGDGQEAVAKLTNGGGAKPHLIITDLNMPVMDGMALIKEIRGMEAYKFTPILMLTTETSAEKKQEGQAAGATGWIVKPFNPDQLIKIIQKVMPV